MAEEDLSGISNYINKELLEPDIARKVVGKIGNEILKLEQMPFRNALVSDVKLAHAGIRKLIIQNFIVFYIVTIKTKIIIIVRILYSKRYWINLI